MPEEIKDLIEKIQEEGIKVAEDKAKALELEARRKAGQILNNAQAEAEKILAEANEKVSRMEQGAKVSINQAGRDLILSLKEKIDSMLQRLIQASVSEALSPPEMARILVDLIKKSGSHAKEDIVVLLKKDDLEKMEREFLSRIKEETKKGIILKPAQDIGAGFMISFDAGNSHFDFTDKTLAEYLGSFIKPYLRQILNGG